MSQTENRPGDAVITDMGLYQHHSVVTDRIGPDNMPMLISASNRTGTVREECWSTVTGGRHTYTSSRLAAIPREEVLARARSQEGKWRYGMVTDNCEQFANWSRGLGKHSKQVASTATGALLGVAVVSTASEKPTAGALFVGALLGAALGLAATFEPRKPTPSPIVGLA